MNRLGVDFLGFSLKNPIAAASGTFGFGKEYAEFYDINQLGAVCLKGLTLHKRRETTESVSGNAQEECSTASVWKIPV